MGGIRLDGARVLLTGATGGLGRAIARALAGRGSTCVLTGRRADALGSLAAELGGQSSAIAADLGDPAALDRLLAEAGAVDVCIANAGIDLAEPLRELTPDEIDHALALNLRAPVMLARAVMPQMVERGQGQIVFISSMAGKMATPGNGPLYAATKWGVRGLGLALRDEFHGTGVGVSTIFPGPISGAGMFARTGVRLPRGTSTNSPQEVAAAVARAIERDIAEIDVAAWALRLGGWLSGVAPTFVSALGRRTGAAEVRAQMISARRAERG